MSPHVLAASFLALVAATIYLPHIADRAIRNHRARKHRAALVLVSAWLDSVQEWLDEEWDNEPTPIHDALVCEQIAEAEGWIA